MMCLCIQPAPHVFLAMQGVSPNLISEICALAEVDPDIPTAQLQLGEWERLFQQWHAWLLIVSKGSFAPCVQPETGRVSVICPVCTGRRERGDPPWEVHPGIDMPRDFSSSGRHSSRGSVHSVLDSAIRSTEVSPLASQRHNLYLVEPSPDGSKQQLVPGTGRESIAWQRRGRKVLRGRSSSCSVW